jgi:hypothetical protein
MLKTIGNLISRKPAKPATPSVPFPTLNSNSASPMRRRQGDPRDTYARIFRWKLPAETSAPPTRVEIVGSFTRWQTVSLTHDPVQKAWSVTISDIPGKRTHHYMLLIDGEPYHDPACDGLVQPMGFDEEQFALPTGKGPRVLMMFAQTK